MDKSVDLAESIKTWWGTVRTKKLVNWNQLWGSATPRLFVLLTNAICSPGLVWECNFSVTFTLYRLNRLNYFGHVRLSPALPLMLFSLSGPTVLCQGNVLHLSTVLPRDFPMDLHIYRLYMLHWGGLFIPHWICISKFVHWLGQATSLRSTVTECFFGISFTLCCCFVVSSKTFGQDKNFIWVLYFPLGSGYYLCTYLFSTPMLFSCQWSFLMYWLEKACRHFDLGIVLVDTSLVLLATTGSSKER